MHLADWKNSALRSVHGVNKLESLLWLNELTVTQIKKKKMNCQSEICISK